MVIDYDNIYKMKDIWIKNNYPNIFFFINSFEIGNSWKEKLYLYKNNLGSIPTCYCDEKLKFISFKKGYSMYCSKKCNSNSSTTKEKRKDTCISKYGVDNPMQDTTFKKKYKNTCINKYGVDNVSMLDSIKDKVKKTNLNKTGYEYPSQNPINKKILSDSMHFRQNDMKSSNKKRIELYLIDKTRELNIDFISNNSSIYKFLCNKCGNVFDIHKNNLNDRIKYGVYICTICNPINNASNAQEQIRDYIVSIYENEVLFNIRNIIDGELDIFIPELNIAIEYNGIYWHSDIFKDKNYHIDKSKMCNNLGIKLIHIWEDEWYNKKEIVISRLNNLIGVSHKIYARKTVMREVSYYESKIFLNENHMQGNCISKYRYGLYHNNELVSLMTFGKLRKNLGYKSIDGKYELLRFCNKLNYTIVGGASKLFKYFLNNNIDNIKEIISYADNSWSSGNLYEKLGFKKVSITKPNYFYVKNSIRYNRFLFRKDILIKEGYDSSLSEAEIMKNRGFYRIYNCGNIKYFYKKDN